MGRGLRAECRDCATFKGLPRMMCRALVAFCGLHKPVKRMLMGFRASWSSLLCAGVGINIVLTSFGDPGGRISADAVRRGKRATVIRDPLKHGAKPSLKSLLRFALRLVNGGVVADRSVDSRPAGRPGDDPLPATFLPSRICRDSTDTRERLATVRTKWCESGVATSAQAGGCPPSGPRVVAAAGGDGMAARRYISSCTWGESLTIPFWASTQAGELNQTDHREGRTGAGNSLNGDGVENVLLAAG